jgi:arylsulfatase A-like enzyme
MVWNVDRAIGRIVGALKANNDMYSNTLVVMSADNGGPVR